MRRQLGVACLAASLLSSCSLSSDDWRQIAERSGVREQAETRLEEALAPYGGSDVLRDISSIADIVEALSRVLESIWGEDEEEVSSDKRFVKYSNAYEARTIVDFEAGTIRIETIAEQDPLQKLEQAAVLAFLTPKNLTVEDIFSDREPELGEQPFLYQQVLDHEGEAIRYEWRAQRFADYLISNQLQQRRNDGRHIQYIETRLVDEHLNLRSLQFSDSVLRYAREYDIAPSLIYAVIEIESAFNPYAVSHANALGLMQIVPSTAGRDVFERVKGRSGEPSREQLFQADFNIDIGSAYLFLLDDLYLRRVLHPQSRTWAKISAYNGGAGNVFRAFSTDREQAIARINAMTPEQVYEHLVSTHPFAETRNYLRKVRAASANY